MTGVSGVDSVAWSYRVRAAETQMVGGDRVDADAVEHGLSFGFIIFFVEHKIYKFSAL